MTLSLLVTGAGGFVGRAVVASALARGHAVTGLDIAAAASLPAGAGYERVDVRDRDALLGAAAGRDAIIHCAAVVGPVPAKADPVLATSVNIDGTLAVLEAARAHGCRVVSLSTATLYGRRDDLEPLDETAPVDPVSVYDATKYMAEILSQSYRKTYGVAVSSFRTGFVYGAGHSTGDYYVHRLLAGEREIEDVGGDHPCDFTYVHDLARGLALAAEAGPLPEPHYNLTGGVLRTRRDLARIVLGHFPGRVIRQSRGVDLARHLRGACLIDRARRDFGYAPEYTLETGIADMVRRARREAAA